MKAFLPALVVALFALWCGTFEGGATLWGAAAGLAVLLLFALLGVDEWRDPWRLGGAARLLPAAAALAVLASWWASPVRRAGLVVIVLLPSLYLLPAAVARCWRSAGDRRRGGAALAAVLAAVALWALAARWGGISERAALPLGHHLPTAAWLLLLLPMAALGARHPGAARWLAAPSALAAAAALASTRSLLGALGLGLELALVALVLGRRPGAAPVDVAARALWPGALLVAGAALTLRLAGLEDGRDPSLAARLTYWRGGWEGWLERPLLGWGPGSTPWTAGLHLEPRPGVNPPGEIVSDLHSLPLGLLYELGPAAPLLVAVALALLAARALASGRDREWATAASIGLAGFAAVSLGGAWFGAAALPVTLLVVVGALAAVAPPPLAAARRWPARLAAAAHLFVAALVLTPTLVAQASYERARAAPGADRQYFEIGRALAQDPSFALYRAIFGGLGDDADEKLRAARAAPGVAALWLDAGRAGAEAGRPWALSALDEACRLAPLTALPSFWSLEPLLAAAADDAERADELVHRAARALAADPRLAAAPLWRRHPALLDRAVARLEAEEALDAGWRLELVRQIEALATPPAGELIEIRLGIDRDPGFTLSELVFRRRPWPADWASIWLEEQKLARLDLPSAARLASTGDSLLAAATCTRRETSARAARN